MNDKGFTIIEIIVVLVIVGLIAAFAVPNFQKGIDRADEQEAVHNLSMVYEAARIYRTRNGGLWTGDLADYSEINATAGVQLLSSKLSYSCTVAAGDDYCEVQTVGEDGVVRVMLEGANEGQISCSTGTCPSGGVGTIYN